MNPANQKNKTDPNCGCCWCHDGYPSECCELYEGQPMNNPPGLIKIETGGSANTTNITIDGIMPMIKRATIIIDPTQGENQIKLHCFSHQNGKYEDGQVQTYCGISQENFEFMKAMFAKLTMISDDELDFAMQDCRTEHVTELLSFIQKSRKVTR